MSDSQFKKAISEKMNESTVVPGELVWSGIDTALAEKRAEKRRRRRLILVFLLPLFAGGLFFLFGESEETIIAEAEKGQEKVFETKNVDDSIFDSIKDEITDPLNFGDTDQKLNAQSNDSSGEINSAKANNFIANSSLKGRKQKNSTYLNKNKLSVFADDFQTDFSRKATKTIQIKERLKIEELPAIELRKEFLSFEKKVEKPEPIIDLISKTKECLGFKSFAVTANFESNKLAYCFDEKANHLAAKVEAEYRITRRFAAGIGIGFHQTKYQFEINETEHLAAFGDTDKYPDFHKINRAVETIGNDLNYFTGSVSATFYQPIYRKWKISIGMSQDFIFQQSQKITYAFFNNRPDLEINENTSRFDIGMTAFRLGVHRSFGEHFTGGLILNRYITTTTIGIERQYYHGFGGSFSVGYLF